jgi:hypothetical protein
MAGSLDQAGPGVGLNQISVTKQLPVTFAF